MEYRKQHHFSFNGKFDLTDGSSSLQRQEKYANEKAVKHTTTISQEELYTDPLFDSSNNEEQQPDAKKQTYARAYANMQIKQSAERNEAAFTDLVTKLPDHADFLQANKQAIIAIIEHAHTHRNERETNQPPLRSDGDQVLYPMNDADFQAEKNYIVDALKTPLQATNQQAKAIIVILMREGWCGKTKESAMETT